MPRNFAQLETELAQQTNDAFTKIYALREGHGPIEKNEARVCQDVIYNTTTISIKPVGREGVTAHNQNVNVIPSGSQINFEERDDIFGTFPIIIDDAGNIINFYHEFETSGGAKLNLITGN